MRGEPGLALLRRRGRAHGRNGQALGGDRMRVWYIDATPGGKTLKAVRDFCPERQFYGVSREKVVEHFGTDITDELLAKGVIEPNDEPVIAYPYRLSELGTRMATK